MARVSSAISAAVLAVGGVVALASVAGAETVSMSVVTGSPPGHIISKGVENWMSCVSGAVGDDIKFNYFPSGQLVPLRELQAGLESGVADSVPIPVGYVSDKLPLNGVSMLPGLGATAQEIISAFSKGVREDEALVGEYEAVNAVPIWVMGFPPYQIISTSTAMRSLADFKGKVIRSAGGSMNLTIEALGAAPAEVVVADLYVSMERGVVDATISGANSVKPYNVQELMKSMSVNGAFGTFTNVFAVNGDKWESLPAEMRTVMTNCGLKTEEFMASTMDSEADALLAEFKGLGVDVYEFTPEETAALNEKLATVQEDWVSRLDARGLPAGAVLERHEARLTGN
jgi:TRAP-type transport system periplasmic protein